MTAERKKNSKIDGRSKCIENKDKERERKTQPKSDDWTKTLND